MQYFIDSATGLAWSFEDDVVVEEFSGSLRFSTSEASRSAVLNVPHTLRPCSREESDAASAPKPLSGDALLQANTQHRNGMLGAAALLIAPLQDATDLGVATDEEAARLKALKEYRVAVSRVDLAQQSPDWPAIPA